MPSRMPVDMTAAIESIAAYTARFPELVPLSGGFCP